MAFFVRMGGKSIRDFGFKVFELRITAFLVSRSGFQKFNIKVQGLNLYLRSPNLESDV
jgi:hypothetical protein